MKKVNWKHAHYLFEMEIHPDDDPENLMKDIDDRNLAPPSTEDL